MRNSDTQNYSLIKYFTERTILKFCNTENIFKPCLKQRDILLNGNPLFTCTAIKLSVRHVLPLLRTHCTATTHLHKITADVLCAGWPQYRKIKKVLICISQVEGKIYSSSDVQIFLRCPSVCFTVKSVYYKKAHKFALACNAFIYRCFNRCTCTETKQRCMYIHKYRWRYSVLSLATEDVDTNQ